MSVAADELPHILIVDDNVDATEVLALLIEIEGFSVSTARTLAEGREQIVRQRPRLIFLDLNLPDGNGMSLLADVKADQMTAAISVVMLSGMMDDKIREEAHLLGADAFLVKPLEHDQMTALLGAI
ncbi:response regulator [Roseateles sp. NT4]|uniref:response regulator n=1 Tax=Roseateles sp. NT4 TaxID=3453715 RepID=UPI003EEF7EB4